MYKLVVGPIDIFPILKEEVEIHDLTWDIIIFRGKYDRRVGYSSVPVRCLSSVFLEILHTSWFVLV